MNFLADEIDREVARASLRRDGPLIGVTLTAKCQDGSTCPPVHGNALIDTGADRSAIEWSDFADAETAGTYHAQGVTSEAVVLPIVPVYLEIDGMPGGVHLDRAAATPHLKSQGLKMLLGRDVLEQGLLTVDGPSGGYRLALPGGEMTVSAATERAPLAAFVAAVVVGAVTAWLIIPNCPSK